MNITDITKALADIQALPISELDKRQPMLVSLLVDLVNNETTDGQGTNGDKPLVSQDWWQTLKELTKDAGFTMLGYGHFSAAYSHPMLPGRVVKVGFKKEDSGAAYTAFCRMHQGRAGIPNIYDVQRHAGCYTVVLDHLKYCERYDNNVHDFYTDIAYDVIEAGEGVEDYGHFEDDSFNAEFVETCQMIREFFKGIAAFDMHSGNIMFSDKDVPYITDPVSFSADADRVKPFSIDPDELLKEIEEMAEQKVLHKAIRRHKVKEQKLWIRQNGRRLRKQLLAQARRHEVHRIKWMNREKEARRDAALAKAFIGEMNWVNVWCKHPIDDLRAIERALAAKARDADLVAILRNEPLIIDKELDKCLMG